MLKGLNLSLLFDGLGTATGQPYPGALYGGGSHHSIVHARRISTTSMILKSGGRGWRWASLALRTLTQPALAGR